MLAPISFGLAALTALVSAQAGPNTLFEKYPLEVTQSVNGTFTILAIDKKIVAALVAPKKLIDIKPNADLYPQGFPDGTHPIIVFGGYDGSIKQSVLEINFLMAARMEVPCVDQLGDGTTCFRKQLSIYLGGDNGQAASGVLPSLVGTLEGTTVTPGKFNPDKYPLNSLGNNQYSFEVEAEYVDNPASGPGVAPEAFQFVLTKGAQGPYDIKEAGFHYLMNQVIIANNGIGCLNSISLFNETFSQPFFGASQVDIMQAPLNLNGVDASLAGSYNGSSYSGNAAFLTLKQSDCKEAAARNSQLLGM